MKHQALFSSKDKSKKIVCRLLQFLFGPLRVKTLFNYIYCSCVVQVRTATQCLHCLSLSMPKSVDILLYCWFFDVAMICWFFDVAMICIYHCNIKKPTAEVHCNIEKPTAEVHCNIEKPTAEVHCNIEKPTAEVHCNIEQEHRKRGKIRP